jgi:hypothetical protein
MTKAEVRRAPKNLNNYNSQNFDGILDGIDNFGLNNRESLSGPSSLDRVVAG